MLDLSEPRTWAHGKGKRNHDTRTIREICSTIPYIYPRPIIQPTRPIYGIPDICAASSTGETHFTLSPENNSPFGTFSLGQSGSSKTPALMMTAAGKESPVRKRVVPQSPQKCEVMLLPVSATFEICLGLPVILSDVIVGYGRMPYQTRARSSLLGRQCCCYKRSLISFCSRDNDIEHVHWALRYMSNGPRCKI
jgi:hypothetical protein